MKARVKYNNEIIDVIQVGTKTHLYDLNNVEIIDEPDYWTRIEHQYAGMALQGMLSNPNITERELTTRKGIVEDAIRISHALVEELKLIEK